MINVCKSNKFQTEDAGINTVYEKSGKTVCILPSKLSDTGQYKIRIDPIIQLIKHIGIPAIKSVRHPFGRYLKRIDEQMRTEIYSLLIINYLKKSFFHTP